MWVQATPSPDEPGDVRVKLFHWLLAIPTDPTWVQDHETTLPSTLELADVPRIKRFPISIGSPFKPKHRKCGYRQSFNPATKQCQYTIG